MGLVGELEVPARVLLSYCGNCGLKWFGGLSPTADSLGVEFASRVYGLEVALLFWLILRVWALPAVLIIRLLGLSISLSSISELRFLPFLSFLTS